LGVFIKVRDVGTGLVVRGDQSAGSVLSVKERSFLVSSRAGALTAKEE
jgi:hypothetical protein